MTAKSVDPATRFAAQADLREALRIAEQIGAMEIVEGADPHLEMGALYELSLQKPVPPVLMFRKIKGYPDDHRVVCNLRSSRVLNNGVGLELVQNYRTLRRKHAEPIPSVHVKDGPVFENVLMDNQVDILAFPAPKWHGEDGGQYIGTECMVIAQDPDNGWVDAGTYRVSVRNNKTLSIFIEPGQARRPDPQETVGARRSIARWWYRTGRRRRSARPPRRRCRKTSASLRRRRRAHRATDQSGRRDASPACRFRVIANWSTRAICPRPKSFP